MPVHITIAGESAGQTLEELRQLAAGLTPVVAYSIGQPEPTKTEETAAGPDVQPVPEKKTRGRKAKSEPAEAKPQAYPLVGLGGKTSEYSTLEDFVDAFVETARQCVSPEDLMAFANANNAMAKRLTDEMANDAIQEIGKVLAEMREALAPKEEPAQEEAAAEDPRLEGIVPGADADMLDEATAPTIDDVRAKCADVLNKKGADALRKILTAFKAEKVKYLKPDDYAAVLKACDMALG